VRFTENVEESKSINAIRSGAMVIAASGMCDAGRIKHHLQHNLGREECAVLFTGFQAQGTLGRRIVDGASSVRLFDEEIPVRARIHTLAGSRPMPTGMRCSRGSPLPPRAPTHVRRARGSRHQAAFAQLVAERLRWNTLAPAHGRASKSSRYVWRT